VRLIDNNTHETRITTTGASGAYIFPIVPAGQYMLEATASGFKVEKRSGITIDVNQNARADFALQVGSVREVVEVKSRLAAGRHHGRSTRRHRRSAAH
jgi:hypothetical protein